MNWPPGAFEYVDTDFCNRSKTTPFYEYRLLVEGIGGEFDFSFR